MIHATLNIAEDVRHKLSRFRRNFDKYSYEIPHELFRKPWQVFIWDSPWIVPETLTSIHMRFPMNTYEGEGIPIKGNHLLNLAFLFYFFFWNSDFPSAIFSAFFRTALFSERLLLHTSLTHFFNTSFGASILRSSIFKSHFLAAVIFSEYLIFRNQTSTKQPLCENRKFFRAVTSQKSYFFGGVIA